MKEEGNAEYAKITVVNTTIPQTGDNSNSLMYGMIIAIALFGIVVLFVRRGCR